MLYLFQKQQQKIEKDFIIFQIQKQVKFDLLTSIAKKNVI